MFVPVNVRVCVCVCLFEENKEAKRYGGQTNLISLCFRQRPDVGAKDAKVKLNALQNLKQLKHVSQPLRVFSQHTHTYSTHAYNTQHAHPQTADEPGRGAPMVCGRRCN